MYKEDSHVALEFCGKLVIRKRSMAAFEILKASIFSPLFQ